MDMDDRIRKIREACIQKSVDAQLMGDQGRMVVRERLIAWRNGLMEALVIITERDGEDVYEEIQEETYARMGA